MEMKRRKPNVDPNDLKGMVQLNLKYARIHGITIDDEEGPDWLDELSDAQSVPRLFWMGGKWVNQ